MRFSAQSARTWWKGAAVFIWSVACLSLASWWLLFSLRQLEILRETQDSFKLADQQKMLIQEGIFLFILLLLGAVALFYYIWQEKKRSQQVHQFFAVFTHEVKTSLASLRLQVESLEEDLRGQNSPHHRLTQRIVKDTVRLELQLENSLFFANLKDQKFFLEEIELHEFLESLKHQWPEITFEIRGTAALKADKLYFEILFKNLIHNAFKHGKAQNITFTLSADGGFTTVSIEDDGLGFSGDRGELGQMFHRHQAQSGSGLGLYLVETIARALGGEVTYPPSSKGFKVQVKFPQGGAA